MHRNHQQQIDYRRVELGIAQIAAHFRKGPVLEDVAAAAHVSPFHFQRMFTASAGVSPKSFARYLSLEHARAALRAGGASLLGAALASFGDVAAAIDRLDSSRAVAGAVAANPGALLIPCHRVIRGSGQIGRYAQGVARKQAIIGREAAIYETAAAGQGGG